jgi:hypothetical protein
MTVESFLAEQAATPAVVDTLRRAAVKAVDGTTLDKAVGASLAAWLNLAADVIYGRMLADGDGDGDGEFAVDISGDHALIVARALLGEAADV